MHGELSRRLDGIEKMLEQILAGLALMLPSSPELEQKDAISVPPGLIMAESVEQYYIGESCVDVMVQTDAWETLIDRRQSESCRGGGGKWETIDNMQPSRSEVGEVKTEIDKNMKEHTKQTCACTRLYAVQGGPTPGVYSTWEHAQTAVRGHKSARCKIFDNELAANTYAAG